MVITINNEKAERRDCRLFEGGFYKIGDIRIKNSGDCYCINSKYYRIDTKRISFDHRLNEYVLNNQSLVRGIIGFNESEPIIDTFSRIEDEIMVYIEGGDQFILLDEYLVQNNGQYREYLLDGNYYHKSLINAKDFSKKLIPSNDYKSSLNYDSKNELNLFSEYYNNLNPVISSDLNKYSSILKDLSFGIEFETSKGIVPLRVLKKTGLMPLRDGSIPGIEYVTVPMSGAKGIHTLINSVNELKKRTDYNDTCSMHIHIGNIPRTKEFILAFFIMTLKFQDEMFSMFPLYKKYNFDVKRKNYTKPYNQFEFLSELDPKIDDSNIDRNFSVLFNYLHQGNDSFSEFNYNLNNVNYHQSDPNGDQKWNIKKRYYFQNFIPLIFGNKQTIEFRLHTPTYDIDKILGFLFINASLINFTIKNEKDILNNSSMFLNEYKCISNVCYKEIVSLGRDVNMSKLNDFISITIAERKSYVSSISKNGDIIGNENNCGKSTLINWNSLLKGNDAKESLSDWFRIQEKLIIEKHKDGTYSLLRASKLLKELQISYETKLLNL